VFSSNGVDELSANSKERRLHRLPATRRREIGTMLSEACIPFYQLGVMISIRVLCWQLTVNARHNTSVVSLSLQTCWQICAKISPSERGLTPRARTYLNAAGRVSGPRKFDGGVLVFPRRSWIVCHGGPTHHGAESGVCVVVRVPLARADGH
jgi:hypothetical protein